MSPVQPGSTRHFRPAISAAPALNGTSWHYLIQFKKINRIQELTLNPRVRGSSPWPRTGSDLGLPARDARDSGVAFPGGGADGARNVRARASRLVGRACQLIASRCTRFRPRLKGSAETAAACGGYWRA